MKSYNRNKLTMMKKQGRKYTLQKNLQHTWQNCQKEYVIREWNQPIFSHLQEHTIRAQLIWQKTFVFMFLFKINKSAFY